MEPINPYERRLAGGQPVTTLEDYFDLYKLYGELVAARKASPDPGERAALQTTIDEVERDIMASKADPALAAQIRAWWEARYPPPLKGRNRHAQ